jgi:hypothetical protein
VGKTSAGAKRGDKFIEPHAAICVSNRTGAVPAGS